jgi:hypothetical protein
VQSNPRPRSPRFADLQWANDISNRYHCGEHVSEAELVDYQRAKVDLLEKITERDASPAAAEVLATATERLTEITTGSACAEQQAEP